MNKIRLSDVADINKSTFKLDDTHQYIYYLDTANITKNTIATIQKLYPEKDIIPSRAKRAVSNNTIIYSSVRPNLCHFGILSNVPDNLVVSTGFITLDVIDNKVDPHYLYYLITTEEKLRYITNIANTSVSSYPSITPEILSNMEIEIINDIDVQKRISSLLKSIDDKIELNNKINAELETMAKTIYDYWFLQFEFPNEEGKPYKSSGGKMVWNEELKREIPEGWEINKLGNIFSFIKGKNPDSLSDEKNSYNSYPYINIEAATGGKMQFCNGKSMILSDGETIMVMDGAASGEIYVGNSGVLGSTFSKLMPKDEKISNSLIYQILGKIKPIYKKANIGSTVPHANKSFIENIQIALPKNVHYFSKFFDEIYLKININKKENRELTSLKEFLLPLLMNEQVKFIDRQ